MYLLVISRWFKKDGEIKIIPGINMKDYIVFDNRRLAKNYTEIEKLGFNKNMVITDDRTKELGMKYYRRNITGYTKPKRDKVTFEIAFSIYEVPYIQNKDLEV